MNLTKFRRITRDLSQKMTTRSSLGRQHLDLKDEFNAIRDSVHRTLRASDKTIPGWREGDDLAALLKCSPDDLYSFCIDGRIVKHALELREEMADLQNRVAALDAEVTPLSQLVDSLKKYVEAQHG